MAAHFTVPVHGLYVTYSEFYAEKDHASNPEGTVKVPVSTTLLNAGGRGNVTRKDIHNIPASLEDTGGKETRQIRGVVGPAQSSKWPETRAEPSIENILISDLIFLKV